MEMTPNRPYLIRALYEWIVDNEMTPYLLVDAGRNNVQVPDDYVEGGRIVLNVSPSAVKGLQISNDEIHFSARFGGSAQQIYLPPSAVLGVYARETGKGMLFETDEDNGDGPDSPDSGEGKRPVLKIVK